MVMQTQPSAQGIASLYMGNPGALQQRIQKDQQAKPGLPPDLKELMALNIVTNEADANKRQQAMNALNQMAPAGQEPPTVAQSIQQQAKQKLQAQMLQQQRQQMAMQEMAKQGGIAGGIPENVPQPEQQPSAGIDELPVEMGLAGGGIVAFSNGASVPRVNAPVGNPQEELIKFLRAMGLTPEEFTQSAPRTQNEIRDMFRASQEASKVLNTPAPAAPAPAAQVAAPVAEAAETAASKASGIRGLLGKVGPALGRVAGWAPTAMYSSDLNSNEDDQLKKKRMYGDMYGAGDAPATIKALAQDPNISAKQFQERAAAWLAQNANQTPPAAAPVAKPPAASAAPAAPARPRPPAAPVSEPAVSDTYPDESMRGAAVNLQKAPTGLDALHEQNLRKRMELDPEARAKELANRYEQMVGRPDTAQYDRLVAELEGRRKQFDAPKAGFDAFAEYMAQVAGAGPQRDWATAGARGAAGQQALNRERQAQQFDLTKQMVDIAQKKLDTERGFKKELFTLTEKERDDVDKQVEAATKEFGLSKREADKFRNDLEMEALRHKNALALENVRGKNQLAAASVRAGGDDAQTAKAEAAFARDPDALAQKKVLEIYAFQPDHPNAVRARKRLDDIRASKYREFGLTLTGAPDAAGPGGNTRMRFDAQGNPIK